MLLQSSKVLYSKFLVNRLSLLKLYPKVLGVLSPLSSSIHSSATSFSSRSSNSQHEYSQKYENSPVPKSSILDKLFGMSSNIASPGTNRWAMFLPACITHMCLGAVYGWSAITPALSQELGMVAAASGDWSLDQVTYPMSIMIATGGVSAALVGKWQIKVGVRKSLATAALLFSGGYVMAASGIASHNLPLLYGGTLLIGLGNGFAYTPPIQALIDWFPDKKGFATGLVIAGFGSGALFFAPAMAAFMSRFSRLPTFLGNNFDVITEGGRQFSKIGDQLHEVVFATAADLAKLPYNDLAEGFYLVGSGSSGVAASFLSVGAIYLTVVTASALLIKRPPPGYLPTGYTPAADVGSGGDNVGVDTALKTPQFWFLFATSTLLCTGGMGLMSVAKPMIQNVFTGAMPLMVTSSFASSYLMAMAVGNLAGRIGWASVSDKIGRRATFNIFTIGAIPLYASIPYYITQCVTDPTGPLAPYYLALFCVSTVTAITIMGGTLAVLPAYEADLYGAKYVGAIHGRFLLSATTATIIGPGILLNLRKTAEIEAINDLLRNVDPEAFVNKFGVALSEAPSLIEAKTLTISKLMTVMPQGTVDPSPFLYNNTMYTMAGLVSLASLLHFLVRPVDHKYFEKEKVK